MRLREFSTDARKLSKNFVKVGGYGGNGDPSLSKATEDSLRRPPAVVIIRRSAWRVSMKLPFLAVALFVVALAMLAGQPSLAQNAFTPDQVKYGPAPPFLPAGAQLAVLEGDPMASSGDFTIRLKMPDGYKIAPHTHPHRENVTVVSGTLKVGMGDQFDAGKMMSFGPGSFAYLDPSMHHYAAASGETVIQIHGMSPATVNYINPADDPTPKK